MKRRYTLSICSLLVMCPLLLGQTLYVPSGTAGIGSSSNGNVGIGTAAPGAKLNILGTGAITPGLIGDGTNPPDFHISGSYSSTGQILSVNNYNGSRVLTIRGDGAVGVGSSNPSGVLDLGDGTHGRALSWGGTTNNYANVWTAYSSASLIMAAGLRGSNTSDTYVSSYGGSSIGRAAIRLSAFGADAGDIIFFANTATTVGNNSTVTPTERVRVSSAGNVGIGTPNPGARLDIGGPTGSQYGTFALKQSSAGEKGIWLQSFENNNALALFHTGIAAYITTDYTIAGTNVPLLLQTTGGSVGIGTTNPGNHRLAVSGSIRAKEVIVDTGWSDYVFAPDYVLAPLSEVEAHIKERHHLPGIPSAHEVAQHGISVGEMQAKLLAKIEELTLHVIAQEKRGNKQQREILSLRAEVSRLSAK